MTLSPITVTALGLALLLSISAILAPQPFMAVVGGLNKAFLSYNSHAVLSLSSMLLIACFMVAISPMGKIRLGKQEETPEFSTIAWLSMLFAAGMGAGLLYWGVAEPITHYDMPPPYPPAMQGAGNARMAIVISYLHWGLHPWGIYAAGSLCIAYFSFCQGYNIMPSTPFRAVLPQRPFARWVGGVIDITCIIALLLGLAAAMAAGTMQITSGLRWLGNPIGNVTHTYSLIIIALVAVYVLSAVTRLDKGIKRLSIINMILAAILAVLICYHTSCADILRTLRLGVLDYLHFLPELSFVALDDYSQPHWSEKWTANYFLSWAAWVPFVGIFIARISKGRTIREFVCGVVLAPSVFTFLWFAVFGGSALDIQQAGALDVIAAVRENSAQALFSLLNLFPYSYVLWSIVVVLVFIFLVTSADSASYVLAMLSGGGAMHPTMRSKVFWGLAIAVLTAATLFSHGGIHSVRAVFSFAGIAVFLILIGQMACLLWGLCTAFLYQEKVSTNT